MQWIFALVEELFKGYLESLSRGLFVENFQVTQQSIMTAFSNRAQDISKAQYRSLESFAFGIVSIFSY